MSIQRISIDSGTENRTVRHTVTESAQVCTIYAQVETSIIL